MGESNLISVIIPVYQAAGHLKKCLESVLAQDDTAYEVILVDDGSTDGSGKICDEYAESDKKVRVFHTKNAGAAAARNFGIDKSKGDYICFIDGDDYVTEIKKKIPVYVRFKRCDAKSLRHFVGYGDFFEVICRKIHFIDVVFDFGMLFVFKYTGFFVQNINGIFNTSIPDPHLTLPLGISFYTFQIASYVIDLYRGKIRAQKNPLILGTYLQ